MLCARVVSVKYVGGTSLPLWGHSTDLRQTNWRSDFYVVAYALPSTQPEKPAGPQPKRRSNSRFDDMKYVFGKFHPIRIRLAKQKFFRASMDL